MNGPYRNLYIWNAAVDLAAQVDLIADRLIQHRRFALADQISRAAISVSSNIAEGYGRTTARDWRRFLAQSRGSLYELETHLEIAVRIRRISADEIRSFEEPIAKISAGLTRLINSATRRIDESAMDHRFPR